MKGSLLFVRWILLVLLLWVAYVNFNAGTFHGRQTAVLLGNAVSLCLVASLLFLNIRVGWPYLRSRFTLILAIGVAVAFVWPRASHFVDVDRCLDSGGMWNAKAESCSYFEPAAE